MYLTFLLLLQFIPTMFSPAHEDCLVPAMYEIDLQLSDNRGGLLKPHRTDSAEGRLLPLDASLRVIIVFVQFPDESIQSNSSEWPVDGPPKYFNSLLAPVRKNTLPYWNRYDESTEMLSDIYQEISRGMFHMTGITRHIIFNNNRSWYNGDVAVMNNEIYSKLRADTTIHWEEFDKWKYLSNGNYRYDGDGIIDMIMMVRRTNEGAAGIAGLDGNDFTIDTGNTFIIKSGYDQFGSGLIQQGNQGVPNSFSKFMSILIHEYGHFLFGPFHTPIGIMTARGGNAISDLFFSPFEKYFLGYLKPEVVNFYRKTDYVITDIAGRMGGSSLLKVPVNSSEFFLIENRRKHSLYDVKMLGDTARLDINMNTGEYGKGIYIYHHQSYNLSFSSQQDQECADGLWNWKILGTEFPDWSSTEPLKKIFRNNIPTVILNDNGDWRSMLNRDGISSNFVINSEQGPGVYFNTGKKHTELFGIGTDREFTNADGYWTSREVFGDRYDAWNIGYNEIFSPYSNPNTIDWEDQQSKIFMHYHTLENDNAHIKIYKASTLHSESQILELTPPSKPIGLIVDYFSESQNIKRPRLTWRHNQEPDMTDNLSKTKYRIYRATSDDLETAPSEHILIDSLTIRRDSTPVYIDHTVLGLGSRIAKYGVPEKYPLRYSVQAVDKYGDRSVKSDFAAAVGLKPGKGNLFSSFENNNGVKGDTIDEDLSIPEKFVLHNNYPNPFNMSTIISYDIPVPGIVNIKIIDITGKEVVTLVNEFKSAGRYSFNLSGMNLGYDLPSGVYFYSMSSNSFREVKRMALLK